MVVLELKECFILSEWKVGGEGYANSMFSGLYGWVCWCQSLRNTENASKNTLENMGCLYYACADCTLPFKGEIEYNNRKQLF